MEYAWHVPAEARALQHRQRVWNFLRRAMPPRQLCSLNGSPVVRRRPRDATIFVHLRGGGRSPATCELS
eukprot:2504739-Pyramimonas_sp.AAC.1